MRIRLILLFVICFSLGNAVYGNAPIKRDKYIDETIFATTRLAKNIESSLAAGYRAFIIDSVSEINKNEIASIQRFLDNHPDEFMAFLQEGSNHFNGDYLFSYFQNQIISFVPRYLPLCDSLLKQKKQILFISDKNQELMLPSDEYLTYVKAGKSFSLNELKVFDKNKPTNIFTVFSFDPATEIIRPDSLFVNDNMIGAATNYLRKTGKFPNFLLTQHPSDVQQIQQQLPFYLKLTVTDKVGNPLPFVEFANFPGVICSGVTHLCTPPINYIDSLALFRDYFEVIPQKKGYRFVPEVFTFNFNNYNQFKTIQAQRIAKESDLVVYMPLDKKEVFDTRFPVQLIENNLNFDKDKDKGEVALFDGLKNSLYFDRTEVSDSDSAFSIALWINPFRIEENYPLLSKPGSYCFKIRKSTLCLTIVDIVEIKSEYATLKSDQWQHVVIVYEKGGSVKFYINGHLADILPAVNFKLTQNSFVLGANQWDEYFNGKMSQLLFWNRPIGADEVADIYAQGFTIHDNSWLTGWANYVVGSLAFLFLMAGGLLLFRKNTRKANPTFTISQNQLVIPTEKKCLVECFGSFSVFNEEGINLADQLSLKKRSFLMVVLYYTETDGGISPQKLADIFWPGYDQARAKNVRGTYIQDIRGIIDEQIIAIQYNKRNWHVALNPSYTSELQNCISILKHLSPIHSGIAQFDPFLLASFLSIVEKGRFAEGLDSPYIDDIKQQLNDQIIGVLELLINSNIASDDELILRICKAITKHDPINELACKTAVLILNRQGKLVLAKKCFEKFVQSWNDLLGEDYFLTFDEFVRRK